MRLITDRTDYWNHYAAGVTAESPEEALKNAFGWTQYAGHGPGDELLGEPLSTLELGSGRGNAVAVLATKGVDATGIDISPVQISDARDRWGHLPGTHYVTGNGTPSTRSGALSGSPTPKPSSRPCTTGSPPAETGLLPPPAVPGSYGIQGMYGNGFKGRQTWIYRWAYEPAEWAKLLNQHGYLDINARIEPAPEPANVGTLIVEARHA